MTLSDPVATSVSRRRILPLRAGTSVDRLCKNRPLGQRGSNRLIANAYPDTVAKPNLRRLRNRFIRPGGIHNGYFRRFQSNLAGDKVPRVREGHGQRVSKLLTCEDFREEVVIPASDLHFASQSFFERKVFESRDGEAS